VCEQIYQTVTTDKLNIQYELKKREYQKFRNDSMKEVDQNHKAYKAGKTVEDLKKPSNFTKAKAWIIRGLLFLFIIRVAVPKEYVGAVKEYFSG
jgi:transposase